MSQDCNQRQHFGPWKDEISQIPVEKSQIANHRRRPPAFSRCIPLQRNALPTSSTHNRLTGQGKKGVASVAQQVCALCRKNLFYPEGVLC